MKILKLIFGINIIFIIYFAKKILRNCFKIIIYCLLHYMFFYRKLNPGKTLTIFLLII